MPHVTRAVILAALALSLGGCGLAGTGVAGAAGGASKAEELKQAQQTEDRVRSQIDAANQAAAEQRRAAEAASQ
jgi:hypothetical protein